MDARGLSRESLMRRSGSHPTTPLPSPESLMISRLDMGPYFKSRSAPAGQAWLIRLVGCRQLDQQCEEKWNEKY